MTDLTYILDQGPGGLCLCGSGRRLVFALGHWLVVAEQTTDAPLQALSMAVWRRKPKSRVLVHSDGN